LNKRKMWTVLALLALAGLGLLAFRWRAAGFDWSAFVTVLHNADGRWLAASLFFIFATYALRVLRWEIMLRPFRPHSNFWAIFAATCIGFTAVVLFGRAGEPVRPYLIAKREGVSFSSQIAAWIVERILDLLSVLSIFGLALLQVSNTAIRPGPRMQLILHAGGYTAGTAAGVSLVLLLAMRNVRGRPLQTFLRRLKFLPERILRKLLDTIDSFEAGTRSMRSGSSTVLLLVYTIANWLAISGVFTCVFLAFSATAGLGAGDIVVLLGFVAFGSAVQLPGVGGGMQIATIVVLTEFFQLTLESATGIALILWIASSACIVPVGLAFAFREGLKFRQLNVAANASQL
jgi:uncharacterized protein (TIRG00374 family)